MQQSRVPPEAPPVNGVSPHNPSYTRARTVSQPYLYNPFPLDGYANGHALPTTDPSRPISPRTSDVKPTRIPMAARTRTISASSHAHSIAARTESRNGVLPHHIPTPDSSPDLRNETDPNLSNATIRRQQSNIMNEPAPFATGSIGSSVLSKQSHHDTVAPPRPSNESEERPFEHWYRGDVHRNGGVGELRVGKRMEMLRIANFGHDIKASSQRFPPKDFSAALEYSRRRKRADSASGLAERESLYLDEQGAKETDMVLDESPPTDIDGDPDTDPEDIYDAYAGAEDITLNPAFSASTPGLIRFSAENTRNEVPAHPSTSTELPRTRIPVARAASEPLRANTSIDTTRSSETLIPSPPASIASSRHPTYSRSQSQTPDQSSSNKRRAKSPASPSPSSTPRKSRAKAKTPPPAARRKEDNRGSVASYPTPEGDGMVDAIPTWTQPVQRSGTWDEVIR